MSWTFKKQSIVSRFSAESEYGALALTAAEVKWMVNIPFDLKIQATTQPALLCDNSCAILMNRNPIAKNDLDIL